MRVAATCLVACYAFVLLAGVLAHRGEACADAARSHCAVCACLNTASLAAWAPPVPTVLADAGQVAPTQGPRSGTQPAACLAARAPPAAAVLVG
jgi:hypothetical protein